MVPSSTWFPSSLPARADWFANFTEQFLIVAPSLNLEDETTQVSKDNAVIQFIAQSYTAVGAYTDAMGQYRRIVTEGKIGDTTPEIPAAPVLSLPAAVPTGIFQRLSELRERIMAAKNYTDEIGALLKILPQGSTTTPEEEVVPTIECFAAKVGYLFTIVVSNRGEADMWEVYVLRKGGQWTKHGTYTGKSADITVEATDEGEPEQIQARVQLRRKNQNYGDPSDPKYVTLNP